MKEISFYRRELIDKLCGTKICIDNFDRIPELLSFFSNLGFRWSSNIAKGVTSPFVLISRFGSVMFVNYPEYKESIFREVALYDVLCYQIKKDMKISDETFRKLYTDCKIFVNGRMHALVGQFIKADFVWIGVNQETIQGFFKQPFLYVDSQGIMSCGSDMNLFVARTGKEVPVDEILNYEIENDGKLKPDMRVLAREDETSYWGMFCYMGMTDDDYYYCLPLAFGGDIGRTYKFKECVRYNEYTKHLLHTNQPYTPPE